MTSFDTPKADAVNIHFQAFSFDFISVAFRWFLALDELATTSNTNVMSVYLVSFHFYRYGCNRLLGIASSIDLNSYEHSATPKLIS
jgi:hypothetical protein